MFTAVFAGSLDVLGDALDALAVAPTSQICVLATAAAFRDPRGAIDEIVELLTPHQCSVVGVPAIDRAGANDPTAVAQVDASDVVIVCDGAPLHARSVWRHSLLAEALARSTMLCVGATGSVLGHTMIDPRGGAPTTGLGLFRDVVITVPASAEQAVRTRGLLAHETLVELGRRSVVAYDGRWRVVRDRDLLVTRDGAAVDL